MNSNASLKIRLLKFILVFTPLIGYWLYQDTLVQISGQTMGTTYSIKAFMPRYKDEKILKTQIDNRLIEVNNAMSTWQKNSEISLFNTSQSIEPTPISDDFFYVVSEAEKIYHLTSGYFDPTVEPLIKLWGFYADEPKSPPTDAQIASALASVGFDKIALQKPNVLTKQIPNLSLNLSAIAKGYGVDEIAKLLEQHNIKAYFVEIGGEVFAKNELGDDKQWKIGISSPDSDNLNNEIIHIVELNNQALATSGDYRNFLELDSQTYSHILDPKTGMSVKSPLTSVSVLAENTTLADGLATAFIVLGVEKSLKIVKELENTEAFFIEKRADGTFRTTLSQGFPRLEK